MKYSNKTIILCLEICVLVAEFKCNTKAKCETTQTKPRSIFFIPRTISYFICSPFLRDEPRRRRRRRHLLMLLLLHSHATKRRKRMVKKSKVTFLLYIFDVLLVLRNELILRNGFGCDGKKFRKNDTPNNVAQFTLRHRENIVFLSESSSSGLAARCEFHDLRKKEPNTRQFLFAAHILCKNCFFSYPHKYKLYNTPQKKRKKTIPLSLCKAQRRGYGSLHQCRQ